MKKAPIPNQKPKIDQPQGFFVQGISAKSAQKPADSSTASKKPTASSTASSSSNGSSLSASQVHKSIKPSNPQKGVPLKPSASKQPVSNNNKNQKSPKSNPLEIKEIKKETPQNQIQVSDQKPQQQQEQKKVENTPVSVPQQGNQAKQENIQHVQEQKEEKKEDIVKHVPIEGKVTIKYNHYNEKFDIIDGQLKFADIDEKYCFSFVFKGNYNLKLKHATSKEYQNSANKIFQGLVDGQTYVIEVDEDPQEVEKEVSRPYNAPKNESQNGLKSNNAQMDHITKELKNMNIDELKEKGDKYKELIEARDLEDMLYK